MLDLDVNGVVGERHEEVYSRLIPIVDATRALASELPHHTVVEAVIFDSGHVDPLDQTSFGFFVTDVTPVAEFYLVEDPRIPSS